MNVYMSAPGAEGALGPVLMPVSARGAEGGFLVPADGFGFSAPRVEVIIRIFSDTPNRMRQPRVAIYPGTFDPVTNGHLDIMKRALSLCDKLIVAVALNPKKNPTFSVEDRVGFIQDAVKKYPTIEVHPFDTLLTDFAQKQKACIIVKGLRAVSDFEYELQMGLMNRNLNDKLETVFMIPSQEFSFLSSSFVKEIAKHGGDVTKMVPKSVLKGFLKVDP